MPSWPSALPQTLLVEGFQEEFPNTVLRTEMDAGPQEQRRRFTAAVTPIAGSLDLTKAELATLRTFFLDDTKGGAVPFDWTHPVTDQPAWVRFAAPPSIRAAAPDGYRVALNLEILP